MTTLLVIAWVVVVIFLLVVSAMRPQRSKHSVFELERLGGKIALRRERLIGDVLALRQFVILLLVLAAGIISFELWQGKGVAAAIAVVILVVPLSRWKFIHHTVMGWYEHQEKRLFRFVEKVPAFGWLFREDRWANHDQKLESVEHLVHLVESAGHILSSDQQHIIRKGIKWHTRTLGEVMTRSKDIVTVNKHELLGPLVLDDLHKSGHHRFPVIQKDINHVVGLVNIAELFQVDADRQSQTAEKLMTPLDVRLSQDTLLPEALKQLLTHPNQVILVVDDSGQTVGIATLGDILNPLLSHR
jgi:Mg2+/Co2+ transporter CorB